MTIGIYLIQNTSSPLFYIGQSVDIEKRWYQHRYFLTGTAPNGIKRIHPNQRLAASWAKYGPECFSFSILEICEIEQLTDREEFWISFHRERFGSNVCNFDGPVGAPWTGKERPQDTRIKISMTKSPEMWATDVAPDYDPDIGMSMSDMRSELRRHIQKEGGIKAFCRANGFESHAPVSLALAGKREISEALANSLGFFRQTYFIKADGRQ